MAERVHGGVDDVAMRERGLEPASIVDFSVNLNPYGPCEPVSRAAREARLDRYPDMHAREARGAWAHALERQVSEIAVGHGAADLFWAIARSCVSRGARVVIAEPTFSEFRIACEAAGAEVERIFSEDRCTLDLDRIAASAQGAAALYLCSPNNPTGEFIEPTRVRCLAERIPHTSVVLDQSFLGLSDYGAGPQIRYPDNVIVVRSLTKEFALAGLRIGLAVGASSHIARLEAQRPTWATSTPALAALVEAATQSRFVAQSWQRMQKDRDATRALLEHHGLRPRASDSSYQLVRVPGGAAAFCARMLEQRVQLRDCSSFGLPEHVRIAALPEASRRELGRALDAVQPAR